MKLVSWNVNGIRACMKKGFADFFKNTDADIFCIQETKMQAKENGNNMETEEILNSETFKNLYKYWNSAEKKGYSGTAIFTKQKPIRVKYGIGMESHDKEGRVITLEYEKFFLVNIYTPNSKRDLERLRL